jgi:hypothetical protein
MLLANAEWGLATLFDIIQHLVTSILVLAIQPLRSGKEKKREFPFYS